MKMKVSRGAETSDCPAPPRSSKQLQKLSRKPLVAEEREKDEALRQKIQRAMKSTSTLSQ
jgi:hypothetical protein